MRCRVRLRRRSVLARCRRVGIGTVVGVVVGLIASLAGGQEPSPPGTTGQPPPPTAAPPPTPPSPGPPLSAYPLELLGLLAPPAQRGPMTLLPSIGVAEEYNDNVHSDNENRESDFITGFSPTIALTINRPSYQLSAGYSFTAALYAKGTQPNEAFQSQNFVASGQFRVSPRLTLSANDSFAYNRDTSLVAVQGVSTGRQESWSNTFTPGMAVVLTPRNSLSLSATYSALRFLGGGVGVGSDTYGLQSNLSHAFTPRFSGDIGYGFTYLDAEETSTTHTPTLGLRYQLTPTLTGTVSGGPAISEVRGETAISPAGTVTLTQTLKFGSAMLQYSRGVGVAGGFGGTTDTQTASGLLTLSGLERGLLVVFGPSYTIAESVSSRESGQVDVRTLTLNLGAVYQIWRYVSVFGGYTFLMQRTGGSSSTQVDVDQNRVRFGLQFGYPINFD